MSEQLSNMPQINTFIANRATELFRAGITLRKKQDINYGTQIAIAGHDASGLICIYWSVKKGLSIVDCSKNPLSQAAIAILQGKNADTVTVANHDIIEASFSRWIGTDESGKGDFFGPLVVCGCCISRSQLAAVRDLGAVDSKTLDSRGIASVAKALEHAFPEAFVLGELMPADYNAEYARCGNLNTLLAATHMKVISALHQRFSIERNEPVDGLVVDMFGNTETFNTRLLLDKGLTLVHRQKGESNTAVAAASVIARATFERRMAELSETAGMPLPYGAGDNVIRAARQYVVKHGREGLRGVAKVHFATMKSL